MPIYNKAINWKRNAVIAVVTLLMAVFYSDIFFVHFDKIYALQVSIKRV